ncbi:MAG: hypothetical protein ACRC6H_03650 [Culicoidibacterales bacterium]
MISVKPAGFEELKQSFEIMQQFVEEHFEIVMQCVSEDYGLYAWSIQFSRGDNQMGVNKNLNEPYYLLSQSEQREFTDLTELQNYIIAKFDLASEGNCQVTDCNVH